MKLQGGGKLLAKALSQKSGKGKRQGFFCKEFEDLMLQLSILFDKNVQKHLLFGCLVFAGSKGSEKGGWEAPRVAKPGHGKDFLAFDMPLIIYINSLMMSYVNKVRVLG